MWYNNIKAGGFNMNKDDLLNKASEFLGEATEKARQFSSEALEASKSFAESAKKTIQAEKLDYEISRKYREIGKLVYSAYEEEGSYEHVADELCEEINALFDQIIAIKLGEDADVSDEEKEGIIEEVNDIIEEDNEDEE
ncbi:hypothetical protein ANASTE_00927 [Anaerofustis stercorihominis DSM 17244]|uniref:Uncharacterized protein n=2 Tax=Anaerofustis stercorihominis TaxID=214853 RepID=B1C870_9FIRM|nr:hypothetical protein ANASTE_00927 [Anaerofustis stercorihominis DSM 17244]